MDWDWESDQALRYPFGGVSDENMLILGEDVKGMEGIQVDYMA